MERLGVTKHGCHCLDTGTTHVVEWVLLGERPTGGLRVGTQCHRLWILCSEALHNLCPEQTACTHLGNLHEVVHADSPEERQTRCESVNVDAGIDTCTQILHTVCQCVGKLDVGCGSCLLHVIAGDGDGVELRHVLRCVFKYVGNDLH